jgi:hypothetical protein
MVRDQEIKAKCDFRLSHFFSSGVMPLSRGKGWDSITGLTLSHFSACLSPGPEFLASYVVVFFMFNDLRRDVIVHFVNIGGIVGHHFLNLFIQLQFIGKLLS